MKNILPAIRQEKAKMVHWLGDLRTTKEEYKAIKERYRKKDQLDSDWAKGGSGKHGKKLLCRNY